MRLLALGCGVVLAFSLSTAAIVAQPAERRTQREDAVRSAAQAAAADFMKNPAAVGLSVGIIDRGQQFRFNFGETAPGSATPPTSQTLYEIGSITKAFTALILAHAVAEKKMNLNDDIRLYLKGSYPNLQYADGGPVKVAYLAAHISQFPRTTAKTIDASFTKKDFEDELRAVTLGKVEPYHYGYSNFGYQVLAVLLENAYGVSYNDLVKRFITAPWQMPSTQVYARTDGMIVGYDAEHHAMPNNSPLFPGAGGMRSNVDDLLKYAAHQLKEDDPVVRSTHRLVFASSEEVSGFSWAMGRTRDWTYYLREDGGTKGFRTFIALFPDEQIAIILLSNETDEQAGRRLYDMLNAILKGLR
jgi:serine-type D-Ala-D-Ala carboxypeptidase/endopeptidase